MCPEEFAGEKAPNFKLLGSWFPDEQAISRTARLVGHSLGRARGSYRGRFAYVRSSYIKSVRLASTLTGVKVVEVLGERISTGSNTWALGGPRSGFGWRRPSQFFEGECLN